MQPKPFKYQIPKPHQQKSGRREQAVTEDTKLAYYVNGEKASEPEYWFYKALLRLVEANAIQGWEFQPSYITGRNLPGEIRLDFLVIIPPDLPIQIDGTWIHKSAGQRSKDKDRDARLNKRLSGEAMPVVRIPTKPFLLTEEVTLETAIKALRGEQFI